MMRGLPTHRVPCKRWRMQLLVSLARIARQFWPGCKRQRMACSKILPISPARTRYALCIKFTAGDDAAVAPLAVPPSVSMQAVCSVKAAVVCQQVPHLPAQAVAAVHEMLQLYSPLEAADAAAIVLDRALAREATLLSCSVEGMRSAVSFLEMLDMAPRQVPSAERQLHPEAAARFIPSRLLAGTLHPRESCACLAYSADKHTKSVLNLQQCIGLQQMP